MPHRRCTLEQDRAVAFEDPGAGLHHRLEALLGQRSCGEVGRITGHHPETVRRYRRGQNPSVHFIIDLCDALGASVDWLLRGRGSPYPTDEPPAAMVARLDDPTIAEVLRLAAARLESASRPALAR